MDTFNLNLKYLLTTQDIKKSTGSKFCRTFIFGISLISDLADSNLVNKLLNPFKFYGIGHFC